MLCPADPSGGIFDLAALAERSLLVTEVDGSDTRYSMLTTVRAVAERWLEEAEPQARYAGGTPSTCVRSCAASTIACGHRGKRTPAAGWQDSSTRPGRPSWAQHDDPRVGIGDQRGAVSRLVFEPVARTRRVEPRPARPSRRHDAGPPAVPSWCRPGPRPTAVISAWPANRHGRRRGRHGAAAAIALELLADVALYEGDWRPQRVPQTSFGGSATNSVMRHVGVRRVGAAPRPHVRRRSSAGAGGPPRRSARGPRTERCRVARLRPWRCIERGGDPGAADECARRSTSAPRSAIGTSCPWPARRSLPSTPAPVTSDWRSTRYADASPDFRRHGNDTHAVTAMRNLVHCSRRSATTAGPGDCRRDVERTTRVSYGAEAEVIADVVERIERRVGLSRFATWWEDGRASTSTARPARPRAGRPHRH